MRNLKRVFSLALALAMVLGMMVISSSAASTYTDFTDADEISNTEAVSVMVGIGVLEGDDNGAFNPDDILTREQAAKIICYMLLGADGAEKLSTNASTFSDVAAGRWSAGYIGYCSTLGIIAGYGDGTFGPTDELTGVQFGKMMLVALGYDPDIEGYVGSDWATNIGADMVDAGIVPSGVIVSEPLSRDDAAQMCLQTLEADMVSYSSKGTTITTTDGTTVITGASSAAVVTRSGTDYRGYSESATDGYQQFCEKYFSDLEKTDGDADEFGRPGYTWVYDGTEISTGYDDAVATYTGRFSYKTLYNALGSTVSKGIQDGTYDFSCILNGVSVDGLWQNNSTVGANYDLTKLYGARTTTGTNLGDRGLLVEFYVDTDDKEVTVVMVNTFLAQVSGDYDDSSEELEIALLDLQNSYDFDLSDYEVTSDLETTLNLDDIPNLADFGDEDYVLITIAGDVVQTVEAANTVEGEVTTYTQATTLNNSTVSVDGTSYNYSITRTEDPDNQGDIAEYAYTIGEDVVLLADSYGFIIGMSDATESSGRYVYIDEVAEGSTFSGTYVGNAFFPDGTNEVITLNKVDGDSVNDEDDVDAGWYTYSISSSGKYTLKSVSVSAGGNTISSKTSVTTNGSALVYYTSSSYVRATNSTIFVVRDEDGDVAAYTGYKNVPTISVTKGDVTAAMNSSGTYASYVFIDVEDGTVKNVNSSSDVIYILSTDASVSVDSSDNTYYGYTAIVNGTKTTLKANDKLFAYVGLYTDVSYDSNGYVDSADFAEAVASTDDLEDVSVYTVYNAGVSVNYLSGVLAVGDNTYALDDDCVIRTAKGNTVTSVTGSRIASVFDGYDDADYFTVSAVFDEDGNVTTLIVAYDTINKSPATTSGSTGSTTSTLSLSDITVKGADVTLSGTTGTVKMLSSVAEGDEALVDYTISDTDATVTVYLDGELIDEDSIASTDLDTSKTTNVITIVAISSTDSTDSVTYTITVTITSAVSVEVTSTAGVGTDVTVTVNETEITSTANSTSVPASEAITVTVTATDLYTVDSVTYSVSGGNTGTLGEGTSTISAGNVTGDVTITIATTKVATAKLKVGNTAATACKAVTLVGDTDPLTTTEIEVAATTDITFSVTANTGYTLNSVYWVYSDTSTDQNTLTANSDGTYTIKAANVTADRTIVIGVKYDEPLTVSFSGGAVVIDGKSVTSYSVAYGSDLTFEVATGKTPDASASSSYFTDLEEGAASTSTSRTEWTLTEIIGNVTVTIPS